MGDVIRKDAVISECGKYRYFLSRTWDSDLPTCLFIMLNPSTADAEVDDPTIRRCIGFAKAWGYGRLEVVNVYAYRATKPADLPNALHERVGPKGLNMMLWAAGLADLVVCAWGTKIDADHQAGIVSMLRKRCVPHYLELTKHGYPSHPLYLLKSLRPVPWPDHQARPDNQKGAGR